MTEVVGVSCQFSFFEHRIYRHQVQKVVRRPMKAPKVMFFHQTSDLTKSDEYCHAPSSSAQPVDPSPCLLFHRWRPALWGWFFLLPFCAFSTSTAFATAVPTAFSKQFSQAFSKSFGRSPCRFCRFCRPPVQEAQRAAGLCSC